MSLLLVAVSRTESEVKLFEIESSELISPLAVVESTLEAGDSRSPLVVALSNVGVVVDGRWLRRVIFLACQRFRSGGCSKIL